MRPMVSFIVAAIALLASGPTYGQSALAREFASLQGGSFTTAQQAATDRRYAVVEAEIVRIWPSREDGLWMYQEQAIIAAGDTIYDNGKAEPYFQRIFRILKMDDGRLVRENYELADPSAAVGAYKDPAKLNDLSPDDLVLGGCANQIERVASGYWRAHIAPCPNTYKGATHMTSFSVYTPDSFVNWDRGFDASGSVVWGPASGGYIFKRKTQ